MGYVARFCELVGCLSVSDVMAGILRLRRINRIRTIQGSLAIEGNTLTEVQITAMLDSESKIVVTGNEKHYPEKTRGEAFELLV